MGDKPIHTRPNLPLVTVWVGCYNHARFVVEALESVRQQTYPNIQLIVWDDCSKDNSVEVIEYWIAKHQVDCTFLKHKINLGICRSLNEALALSHGKYVSGVAADDVWLPTKTATQVGMLERLPEDVGVVYSDAYQIDEGGKLLPEMFIEAHRLLPTMPEGWIFDTLIQGNFIPAMTSLTRRRCLEVVGNYDENLVFEDWDMWLRISRQYRFAFDRIPSAKYRIVATSMVRTMSEPMWRAKELIKAKCYFRGWLSTEQRSVVAMALDGIVWRLYEAGLHIPLRWKLELLRRDCSSKTICLIVCSTCGLCFAKFQQILSTAVAIKRKLFSRWSGH